VGAAQLARTAEVLSVAPPGALRVAVLHHQLIGAPWRTRKKPVARRSAVLAALVEAGADLVLAGHVHQSAVSERREFEVVGDEGAVVVSTAPGLGHPRPRMRGEARGLHVYEVEPEALSVATHMWTGGAWELTAQRRFPRGREPVAGWASRGGAERVADEAS